MVMVSVMSTVIIIQLRSKPRPTPQSRNLHWDEILLDQDSHLLSPLGMFWQVADCCYKPGPGSTCHQSQPAANTRHNYYNYTCNCNIYYNYNNSTLYTSKHVVHRDPRKLWNCGAWSVVTIAKVYNNCPFKTQTCGGSKALKTTKLSF